MKRKTFLLTSVAGALLLIAGGCYEYPMPPAATATDTFTHRTQDKADKMLDGVETLMLANAQRIALINNPTYIAAHHSVSAALMRYRQAIGAYSPVISAGFSLSDTRTWTTRNVNGSPNGRTGMRNTVFGTSTGVGATWLVFDGLAREFEVIAKKHALEYYKQMDADYCRKLMYNVAYAYNTVLLAIANRRIAEENRKFQQTSLKDTNYKFQAGAVPLSDVLNFQIEMNKADVDMIAADYQYDTAVYALAVLMGYPEGTLPSRIKFPKEFSARFVELPAVEVYLDLALANRPDLKGYREQLKIARYDLYKQYSSFSPTVNAFANFDFSTGRTLYSGYGYPKEHTEVNQPSFSYGFTADWTLFNGLIRYNKMREYQAELAVADYNVAAQWFLVVGEVRAAYANYIQNVKMTKLYKKTRDLSAKQRELVDDEYRAGNAELTRLNEAQRDLVEAESNLASSYVDIQNAKAQLDSAVGANSAEFYLTQPATGGDKTPGLGARQFKNSRENAPAAAPNQPGVPGAAKNVPVSPSAPSASASEAPVVPATSVVISKIPAAPKKSAAPAIPASPTAPPPAPTGK